MPHKHTRTVTTVDKYESSSTFPGSSDKTPDSVKSNEPIHDSPKSDNGAPEASMKLTRHKPMNVTFTANMHTHNSNDVSQSNDVRPEVKTEVTQETDAKTKVSCTCCDKLVAFFGC